MKTSPFRVLLQQRLATSQVEIEHQCSVKIETYRRSAQVTVGFVYTVNDGKVSTVKIN
jgi:hypothetical protein